MSNKLVITDNTAEKLTIISDGERFALDHYDKDRLREVVIFLNPREAQEVYDFMGKEK